MTKLPQELPPLSLYVHIPWCAKKCPYCDFNSHTSDGKLPESNYVAALMDDLDGDLAAIQGRELESIFFGGGTPSLFSAGAIGSILQGVADRIEWRPDIEITLEANPGTVDEQHFHGFREAGINRLSLGVQSFDDEFLAALGRIHNGAAAERAVHRARSAGFANINLDLMYGLPKQGPVQALADLDRAIALAPQHLSWYELTLEPNTAFYSQPPPLPDEDLMCSIEDAGRALLSKAGYLQYEISAYARDHQRARHNVNYWQFGDYLGIGAGAHSKITWREQSRIERCWKTRTPADYLKNGDRSAATRSLDASVLPLEFMMNALRLREGVDAALLPARTGIELAEISAKIQSLREQGLLVDDPERLATTIKGARYLDSVLQHFMTA